MGLKIKHNYYAIEKGIPIPSQSYRYGLKDAVSQMEIGDSMVIKAPQKVQVFTAAKRLDMQIVSRTLDEDSIRVWRVKKDVPVVVAEKEKP